MYLSLCRQNITRSLTDGFETTITTHFQEPIVEERNSLDALKVFVTHTCEVLGLWKILCENQLNNIVNSLSKVIILISPRDYLCKGFTFISMKYSGINLLFF